MLEVKRMQSLKHSYLALFLNKSVAFCLKPVQLWWLPISSHGFNHVSGLLGDNHFVQASLKKDNRCVYCCRP